MRKTLYHQFLVITIIKYYDMRLTLLRACNYKNCNFLYTVFWDICFFLQLKINIYL